MNAPLRDRPGRRRPPRLAALLLDVLLRGGAAEAVRGDIEERYLRQPAGEAGRRWYWQQTLQTLAAWWRPAAITERRHARVRPHRRGPTSTDRHSVHQPISPGYPGMSSLLQDLRFAVRSLVARPMFLAIVTTALALGIGATTAVYSIVDGVLLRPLPYDDPGRLVVIGSTSPSVHNQALTDAGENYGLMGPSVGNFLDWRERAESVRGLAAVEPRRYDLRTPDGPEPVTAAAVTEGFFELLGARPEIGRGFVSEEYREGRDDVALLSYGAWQSRYGGDPNVAGKVAEAVSGPLEIVGVLPASFETPEAMASADTALWLPLAEDAPAYADRGTRTIYAIARLSPGVSLTEARAEFWALGEQIAEEFPDGNVFEDGTHFGTGLNPLHAETVADTASVLVPLLGAVLLLLLIACANVANLYMAQGIGRQRELAVRAALGAGRGRIVRQLLTESVLMAALAGVGGVALAYFAVRAFVASSPAGLPRLDSLGVDLRVLAFALVLSTLTGVAFGLFPALNLSRSGPGEVLKAGNAVAGTPARRRFRTLLVVLEAALAVILSVGAGLLFSSFLQLRAVNPGFDPEGLTTFRVAAPGGFGDGAATLAFQADIVEQLRTVPGITGVATASNLPVERGNWRAGVRLPGEAEGEGRGVDSYVVSEDYFQALGVKMLRGRVPGTRDRPEAGRVIAVNQAFVDELLGGAAALGTEVNMGFAGEPFAATIVGVVDNLRQIGLSTPARPALYAAATQLAWPFMKVVLRSDATVSANVVRQAIQRVDPDVPVTGFATMVEHVGRGMVQPRFYSGLMAGFAALALLMAAAGIYSATLYAVRARTREVGIRMALGALPGGVRALVVRQGMAATITGVTIGIVGAWFLSRLIENFLYGVTPTDGTTFLAAALTFLGVAWVACLVPAHAATRVDVLEALRSE